MKVGDKVKPIRGMYIGKVGIVKSTKPMAKSISLTDDGLEVAEYEDCCECEAEDGTIFFAWEDVLELIE